MTLLTGCVVGRLSAAAPAGYTLAGIWKLDPAHSDNVRQVLARHRPHRHQRKQSRRSGRGMGAHSGAYPGRGSGRNPGQDSGRRPGTQQGPDTPQGPGGDADMGPPRLAFGAGPDNPILQLAALQGDYLTIRQQPSGLSFDNGDTTRSFIPGMHSVISVPSGVADQRSGWKGRQYVIEITPQEGPRIVERYALSPDGRQLIAHIRVASSGHMPTLHLVRTYDRTSHVINLVPSDD